MFPAIIDLGISQIPHSVFVVIHLVALIVGVSFARKAFVSDRPAFAWGFTLFAVGEIIYVLYHVGTTTFLLSHTIAEVLNLVAFTLVFVGLTQTVTQAHSVARTSQTVSQR